MSKKLAEAFHMLENAMAVFEEQDPNSERFTKVYRGVTECISCYKVILEEKKKASVQSCLDAFFHKVDRTPSTSASQDPVPSTSQDPVPSTSAASPAAGSRNKPVSPVTSQNTIWRIVFIFFCNCFDW